MFMQMYIFSESASVQMSVVSLGMKGNVQRKEQSESTHLIPSNTTKMYKTINVHLPF